MAILNGILGIVLLLGIAFLASNNRRRIRWRLVASGFGLQFVVAILVLRGESLGEFFAPLGWPKAAFEVISTGFVKLLGFSIDGAKFVFGDLALSPGDDASMGYFFAFQTLPTIIFFASLMSVLYHLGVMQRIVQGMAWVMARLMGTSGAESLASSANIFVGQTEAPLLIRPFLPSLTQSELLTVMVGGMCTIAGGVMAAYVQMLGFAYAETQGIPLEEGQIRFAAQLLGASIMAAPAGLAISKILLPETGEPVTKGTVRVAVERRASNLIESAAIGASDGLKLALNVGAMLIAFIALIALLNYLLEGAGELTGLNAVTMEHFGEPLSFKLVFGLLLQFLTFAMGVSWNEALEVGSLIGTKIVLNEFVGYVELSSMIESGKIASDKAITIATFALCGFANFSSIAIQIGGIAPLAPERRKDLASLGMRALLGGTLANLVTATVAGMLFV